MKSLSRVQLFATPWTVAYQALPSMEFSRQAYWSGLPFPSPGGLPNPGVPHCRWILYQLSHQTTSYVLENVQFPPCVQQSLLGAWEEMLSVRGTEVRDQPVRGPGFSGNTQNTEICGLCLSLHPILSSDRFSLWGSTFEETKSEGGDPTSHDILVDGEGGVMCVTVPCGRFPV